MTLASIHPTGIAAYAGNGSVRKGEAQRNRQAETSGQVARGLLFIEHSLVCVP